MKKQKQMSPYLFLLGYIVLFITNVHAINTLRPNELIFSTGHYIKDGTNVEAGMTSPIPNNICYKKTQKSSCEYTYEQYYVAEFPSNPVPGTMNIGLILDENDTEKDLRIMVSKLEGTSTVVAEPSIQGFTEELINGTQQEPGVFSITKQDGILFPAEPPQGSMALNIIGAYTNFQVGKTRYGKSLWIYKDLEEDLLTIGGFDGVDWALEPVVANPFSINSITSQNLSATASENPGITYLTERIEVRDTDTGGRVCLFASGNCHEDLNGNVPKAGLFIEGDVLINKLFGLIGFVAKNSINEQTSFNDTLKIYLDVNMDGCKSEKAVTYTDGNLTFPNNDGLNNAGKSCSGDKDDLNGFMITAIGYLGLKSTDQENYTFWMAEGDSCSPTESSQYSNTGMFDFQTNWNQYASFTFLYTKSYSTTSEDQTLKLKFCTNASTTTANISNVYYGAAVYGIPVSK